MPLRRCPRRPALLLFALLLALCSRAHAAPVDLVDDGGQHLHLPAPAGRIVSLAPNVAELLYAAGAGPNLVGTVAYSDYPQAARQLPRVGDSQRIDSERLLALRPDLIIAWLHGNAQAQLEQLRRLGIPLYYSEPKKLSDIGPAIRAMGKLAGTEALAEQAARQYQSRLDRLTAANAGKPPVRVFFQIWDQPLMTINDHHLIADAIHTCGGVNVFGTLAPLVPTVNAEAVIAADPQAIVATGADAGRPPWLDEWRHWPKIAAVRDGNLYFIDPDLITRLSPRVLGGVERLCRQLDQVRAKARK
jgi:iron complex transport system substrate-binding protein